MFPRGPKGSPGCSFVRFFVRETLLPSSWMISQLMMKEGRVSREREWRTVCVCVCVYRSDIFARKGTHSLVIGATGPPGSQEFWLRPFAFVCIFRRMDRFQNLGNNAEILFVQIEYRIVLEPRFNNLPLLLDRSTRWRILYEFTRLEFLQSFRTKFCKTRLG